MMITPEYLAKATIALDNFLLTANDTNRIEVFGQFLEREDVIGISFKNAGHSLINTTMINILSKDSFIIHGLSWQDTVCYFCIAAPDIEEFSQEEIAMTIPLDHPFIQELKQKMTMIVL